MDEERLQVNVDYKPDPDTYELLKEYVKENDLDMSKAIRLITRRAMRRYQQNKKQPAAVAA